LDESAAIEWWFRNDPALLRIPTPIGYLEADFVYRANVGEASVHGVLEVKGDIFWDGDGSDPRVKAAAAANWARVASSGDPEATWVFGEILEQDALAATSYEELRSLCVVKWPE
jgi:hypothetical protein